MPYPKLKDFFLFFWWKHSFYVVCQGGTLRCSVILCVIMLLPWPSPIICCQGEALRQVLVNRYHGNVKQGGRRESATNFSNGPLTPVGQTKTPTGLCASVATAISFLVHFPFACVLRVPYESEPVARRQEQGTHTSCVNRLQTHLPERESLGCVLMSLARMRPHERISQNAFCMSRLAHAMHYEIRHFRN